MDIGKKRRDSPIPGGANQGMEGFSPARGSLPALDLSALPDERLFPCGGPRKIGAGMHRVCAFPVPGGPLLHRREGSRRSVRFSRAGKPLRRACLLPPAPVPPSFLRPPGPRIPSPLPRPPGPVALPPGGPRTPSPFPFGPGLARARRAAFPPGLPASPIPRFSCGPAPPRPPVLSIRLRPPRQPPARLRAAALPPPGPPPFRLPEAAGRPFPGSPSRPALPPAAGRRIRRRPRGKPPAFVDSAAGKE